MKRFPLVLMLIVGILAASFSCPAPAQADYGISFVNGTFVLDQNVYWANGQATPMEVAPFSRDNRSFVPVRYLANMLGMDDQQVSWNSAAQGVNLDNGQIQVQLYMGDNTLYVDGLPDTLMDVTPLMENGHIFLPARWVAEAFNATVNWDPAVNAINISSQIGLNDNGYNPADDYSWFPDSNYTGNDYNDPWNQGYPPYNNGYNNSTNTNNNTSNNTNNTTSTNTNTSGQSHPWSEWGLGYSQQEYVDNNNRSYDWYIDQYNTGTYWAENCGPSSITMACKWSDPSFNRTAQDARNTYQPNGGWWYISLPGEGSADMNNYLDLYNIPYSGRASSGQYEDMTGQMKEDLRDGYIIILCIDSSYITENDSNSQRTGKPYSAGVGSGHFIIVKGFATVDNQTYFEVYDPANGNKYYNDGTPMCKDRYYSDDDIQSAMSVWWNNYLYVGQVDSGSYRSTAGTIGAATDFSSCFNPMAYGGLNN